MVQAPALEGAARVASTKSSLILHSRVSVDKWTTGQVDKWPSGQLDNPDKWTDNYLHTSELNLGSV